MTTNLTTRELFDAARELHPAIEKLNAVYEYAINQHRVAKNRYETADHLCKVAESKAFSDAVEAGAKIGTAEHIARVAVAEQRNEVLALKREMDRLDGEAEAARVGSSRYQSLLENYQAISHTLNRELKVFASVGGEGY